MRFKVYVSLSSANPVSLLKHYDIKLGEVVFGGAIRGVLIKVLLHLLELV